jgi:hypothetical protein
MKPLSRLLAVFALTLAACGGCSQTPYQKLAWGFRTVSWTSDLAEGFDAALKDYGETQHTLCIAKAPSASQEYATCIRPALDLLRAWTGEETGKPTGKGVLPAIQSAQKVARLSLNAAYDYILSNGGKCHEEDAECQKKLGAWKVLMKPGLCALVEIVDRAVQLGAYKTTEDPAYKAVKTFATAICK